MELQIRKREVRVGNKKKIGEFAKTGKGKREKERRERMKNKKEREGTKQDRERGTPKHLDILRNK